MRIVPVIVPHLMRPTTALWRDAILAGAVTLNDASSIAACVAVTGLVWDALAISRPPEPRWWLDRYVALARPIEGNVALQTRGGEVAATFMGPIWRLVETEVASVFDADLDVRTAGQRWYSVAFLLETLPSVLHILARHADDPEKRSSAPSPSTTPATTTRSPRSSTPCTAARRWVEGLAGGRARTMTGRCSS